MARKTQRAALVISAEERRYLEQLSHSRKVEKRAVERAAILLRYARGEGIPEIHRALNLTRATIYKCNDKALAMGVHGGLKDRYHRSSLSPQRLRRGSSIWPAPNPLIMGSRQSCGRSAPWRAIPAFMPQKAGMGASPVRARRRCGGS
jgi:hypothetical protein